MKKYEATFKRYFPDSNETGRTYTSIREYEANSLEEAMEIINKEQARIERNIESGHLAVCWGRELLGVVEA